MLKSIVVRGNLSTNNHTLSYALGNCEAISNGRWQIAISSITFFIGPHLPWNSVFQLRSNYIDTVVPTAYGTEKKEMTLAIIRLKGNPREKILIGFKTRDFYEITRPSRIFKLSFDELHESNEPPQPTPAPEEKSVDVCVLLLLRRIE